MKKYKYSCDGGSILIGNEQFACCFMNDYGDGVHTVYVYDKGEGTKLHDSNKYDFLGCVVGNFNLYDYDCYDKNARSKSYNILCNLNGRYGVFAEKEKGTMHISYWDDYNV